jgi:uncharacterized protein
MKVYEFEHVKTLIGRLEMHDDVIGRLNALAEQYEMKAAEIRAMGAVTDLAVTEWDTEKKVYLDPVRREDLAEVLLLYGNLSLKDGKPFWHLHISAAYIDGAKTIPIAGHLVAARVFALEFVINIFDGPDLIRTFDENTGLSLWK